HSGSWTHENTPPFRVYFRVTLIMSQRYLEKLFRVTFNVSQFVLNILLEIDRWIMYNFGQGDEMSERRRHPRNKATHIVTQLHPKQKAENIHSITKDVSQAGAGIYCDRYIEPGSYVKVRILKDNHQEIKDAVVAWSNLTKDEFGPVFQIGLNIP
ncbi:MAG: PilZ domain-containing protein, partial [Candidatus Omnitrophota bacterium]